MHNKILLTVYTCLLVLFAIGCRQDAEIIDTVTTTDNPIIVYQSGVRGLVTDRTGSPIAAASVSYGQQSTLSDENGYFLLENADVIQHAVLTVEKADYFKAIQTITVNNGEIQRTKIQLTPRTLSGTISATTGGTIDVNGGGKVSFEANSFQDENNNFYTGNVNVYTTYVDPTIPDLHEIMPGNLAAINSAEEEQLLTSFGMINVELEGDAGEILQINQAATLETPVPASILSNAPSTIPLWHFDETRGLWIEEGEASLQGDTYIGNVAHFSWWNCDVPSDFVLLTGEIQDGTTTTLPNLKIKVTRLSDNTFGITYSDDSSNFAGLVPKSELLLIEVFNICNELLYSEEIGPLEEDTFMEDVTISFTIEDLTLVSGTIISCDNIPINNGYVIISLNNGSYADNVFVNASGNFSAAIPICDATELSIVAYDLEALEHSEIMNIAISPEIDLGTITACGNAITEGFFFTFNGVQHFYSPCNVYIGVTDSVSMTPEYRVIFSDEQANGTINYGFFIFNWSGDVNASDFGMNSAYELEGNNLEDYYSFDADTTSIELVVLGEEIGQIMAFEINDASITHIPSGEVSNNQQITINAIITE